MLSATNKSSFKFSPKICVQTPKCLFFFNSRPISNSKFKHFNHYKELLQFTPPYNSSYRIYEKLLSNSNKSEDVIQDVTQGRSYRGNHLPLEALVYNIARG